MKIRISFALVAKMEVKNLILKNLIAEQEGKEIIKILERLERMSEMDAFTKQGLRSDYRELADLINRNKVLFNSLSETLEEFREELYI